MRDKDMKTVLGSLKHLKIGIYLEDAQFVEGVLLDVKQDHIAVDVDGKVCYFILEHIQALSKNAKDFRIFPQKGVYQNSNDLKDVLRDLRYNWVTINSLSKQALFGVLSSILEDYIIVINQQELHYIAKSHISNIHKGISEQENNLLYNKEKVVVQQLTANIEINDMNEQYTEISKEKTIPSSVSELIEETNQLPNYSEEKVKINLHEKKVVLDYHENTNSVESEKLAKADNSNVIKHLLELLNIKIQSLDLVNTINDFQKTDSKLLYLDLEDLPSMNNEYVLHNETNRKEVIQDITDLTNNELKEAQNTEPSIRKNERRILLTPWSKMNYDQNAIVITPNNKKKSPNVVEPPVEKKQILIEEMQDHSPTYEAPKSEEMNVSMESSEPVKLVASGATATLVSSRERKAMLEQQYYALMRHAEQSSTNLEDHLAHKTFHPSSLKYDTNSDGEIEESQNIRMQEHKKREKAMLEKQFYSLMRHAAKMYRQLRDF